jgi:hypothetical protein
MGGTELGTCAKILIALLVIINIIFLVSVGPRRGCRAWRLGVDQLVSSLTGKKGVSLH